MKKGSFLLHNSQKLPLKRPLGVYDPDESLNVVMNDGIQIPLVKMVGAPPTYSKTCAAPGDDDPDPGQEICY